MTAVTPCLTNADCPSGRMECVADREPGQSFCQCYSWLYATDPPRCKQLSQVWLETCMPCCCKARLCRHTFPGMRLLVGSGVRAMVSSEGALNLSLGPDLPLRLCVCLLNCWPVLQDGVMATMLMLAVSALSLGALYLHFRALLEHMAVSTESTDSSLTVSHGKLADAGSTWYRHIAFIRAAYASNWLLRPIALPSFPLTFGLNVDH